MGVYRVFPHGTSLFETLLNPFEPNAPPYLRWSVIGQRGDEMFYRKNVGSKERWARVIGGALIVACSLTQIGVSPLGLVLAISGVLTALTGLIGFCPACAMAGRKPLEGPP
jgi:hypothetical protein